MSTGDVGQLDADGRLYVGGRDDEMIVSGGENVFPREVEDLLAAHPAVLEAAVSASPTRTSGSGCSAVVVRPGRRERRGGPQAQVRENLARHKVPRDVRSSTSCPATPPGRS